MLSLPLKSVNNLVKDARKVQQTILMVGDISDIYVTNFKTMMRDAQLYGGRAIEPSPLGTPGCSRNAATCCGLERGDHGNRTLDDGQGTLDMVEPDTTAR